MGAEGSSEFGVKLEEELGLLLVTKPTQSQPHELEGRREDANLVPRGSGADLTQDHPVGTEGATFEKGSGSKIGGRVRP